MDPSDKRKVDFKKIFEVGKVFVYSIVFSVLLLLVILAVLDRSINLSRVFEIMSSKATFTEKLKALPINK